MSNEYAAKAKLDGTLGGVPHAYDFMAYAYLQMGQDIKARALIGDTMAIKKVIGVPLAGATARAAVPARYMLERQDWQGAAQLQPIGSGFPMAEAITYFARAMGGARSGNTAAAQADIDKLKEQRAARKKGVLADVSLSAAQVDDIVEFLKALTDPCLTDHACLTKWIPGPTDPDPDGLRLCARDRTGKELWAPSCAPAQNAGCASSSPAARRTGNVAQARITAIRAAARTGARVASTALRRHPPLRRRPPPRLQLREPPSPRSPMIPSRSTTPTTCRTSSASRGACG